MIDVAINKKNGGRYKVYHLVTDTTNKDDGDIMVEYESMKTGRKFVRELEEFLEKFDVSVALKDSLLHEARRLRDEH